MGSRMVGLWVGRTRYGACWRAQEAVHAWRQAEQCPDVLLLTEHEHTYTTGRRGSKHLILPEEELARRGIEFFQTDRGGDITYHGPGQLVGYPILRLQPSHGGVVGYLRRLERALVGLLEELGVAAEIREGLTGVWTARGKIASIGVRLSAGVSLHGFALNVEPDLEYFGGIVPCGLQGCVMSSVAKELGAGAPGLPELAARATAKVAEALGMEVGEDGNGELFSRVKDVLG